jgi:hypothetical protein
MKRISLLVAVAAMVSFALSGCASNAPKPLSPAQVAAIACPQINLAVSQLTAFNAVLDADPATAAFGAKANVDIAKAQPVIAAVCAAGATVTATNLQALASQALPALGTVVGSLPLPAPQEAQIQGALVLAETAFGLVGVVEQQIKAAQSAPASAASAG